MPSEISSENSRINIDECFGGRYNVAISNDSSALSTRAMDANDENSPRSMSLHTDWFEKMAAATPPFPVLSD